MKKLVALLMTVFAFSALAEELKVATGGPKGTYSQMLREISQFCSTPELTIKAQETSGSVENLSLLLDNQVNAAFVQTDVVFFKDKTDNLGDQVKTVMALHPEEVHIVALSAPLKQVKKGEHFWSKDTETEIPLNSLDDLANRPVGAAGGSYITAQLIRLQSEIPFQVVELPSSGAVIEAVKSGQIAAGILVGGQPLGDIFDPKTKKGLGKEFKLLPILPQTADKLKNVYRVAHLKYPSLSPNSITTVATDALFVTGNYKTPKMVNSLRMLHDCVVEHLADFQETTGFHAKWRAVDPTNRGKWPSVYQFPVEEKRTASDGRKKKS
jgi:uncharacterized protein